MSGWVGGSLVSLQPAHTSSECINSADTNSDLDINFMVGIYFWPRTLLDLSDVAGLT